MKFSDIPAHEDIKLRLKDMVDTGRIPHAILLEGPAGIGKMAVARALAQYIHCSAHENNDSCGHCAACIQSESLSHIDTHYVFPVVKLDKMNTPPISDDFYNEWREYLSDHFFMDMEKWSSTFPKKNAQPITYVTESADLLHKLSFTTHISNYKTVIWWLPERMNEEAANKLLKMIEEPFRDTIFIMVSDTPSAILPTIYSRVQRISMKRLPDNVIVSLLQNCYNVEQSEAVALAHIADGNMTNAIQNISLSASRHEYLDRFISLMRLAYQRKIKDLREWANELAVLGREQEIRFYDFSTRLLRENFIYNFRIPELNYMNNEESSFSKNFARFINERNVERLAKVFDNAKIDIAGNSNGKIVNLDVAIKVIMLLKS